MSPIKHIHLQCTADRTGRARDTVAPQTNQRPTRGGVARLGMAQRMGHTPCWRTLSRHVRVCTRHPATHRLQRSRLERIHTARKIPNRDVVTMFVSCAQPTRHTWHAQGNHVLQRVLRVRKSSPTDHSVCITRPVVATVSLDAVVWRRT